MLHHSLLLECISATMAAHALNRLLVERVLSVAQLLLLADELSRGTHFSAHVAAEN